MSGFSPVLLWRRFCAETGRKDGAREFGLSFILALQIGIMFVMAPLAATGVLPPEVVELSRLGLGATAVILLAHNRVISMVIAGTFVVSLLLSVVARSGEAGTIIGLERIAAGTGFDLAVAWVVWGVAFGGGRVNVHRIMGAVILYLSIGLVFANCYRACVLLLPGAFAGLKTGPGSFFSESLYFSLTTLTTTGYGDIAPLHPFVRSMANLEAVIGQLFPATLLARLVTLHVADRQTEKN